MDRSNHYETAFEAYLRWQGVRFVPVDEARRARLGGVAVKSADFLVVASDAARLVVDVKGRRFPGGRPGRPRKTWPNWSEAEDVDGLESWAERLGEDYQGVLAFVYHIVPPFAVPEGTIDRFAFRDREYLVRAVAAQDYRPVMRPRSQSWGTVHLPSAEFRRLVRPFSEFLGRT
jgi:hypothetical protein